TALVNHYIVANDASRRSLQRAILYITTGDLAHFRNSKYLAHFGPAGSDFALGGLQQAQHRVPDLLLDLVDNRVEPDVDALDLGDLACPQLGPDIEPDDY